MTPPAHTLTGARHRRIPTAAGPVDLWWYVAPHGRPLPGRTLLRHAVAFRQARPVTSVTVVRDPLGRPELAPGQNLLPLRLAAAHCGPVTVAALLSAPRDTTRIGIGIEHLASMPPPHLLRSALRPGEDTASPGRPVALRREEFLTLWTARQAVAKTLGWSLLRALVDTEIALRPRLCLARLGHETAPRGWQLIPLTLPGAPHTVTLALHQPPPRPRRETPWTSPAGRH
ncbi:4'-phosphopantetheinyl transferase family protein [Streptomyces sp. NPDC092952]|uniref:4'-phosphopantetheinyl transferase family protein n=1 Tax=Streptomyces sp. NPDC092952 TaxID=3366018 RepID=UPI003806B401